MTETTTLTGAQTQSMVLLHRVFRREFRLLAELIEAARPASPDRVALLCGQLDELVSILVHHHEAEDDVIWPFLLGRPDVPTDLVTRMTAQHERIEQRLHAVRDGLAAWRRVADVEVAGRLAGALRELVDALTQHLDDEEAHVLPIVARTLPLEQWELMARRGMGALPKARRMIMLGRILEDATTAERTEFMRHVPVPIRMVYRVAGVRRYRMEVSRTRAHTHEVNRAPG